MFLSDLKIQVLKPGFENQKIYIWVSNSLMLTTETENDKYMRSKHKILNSGFEG